MASHFRTLTTHLVYLPMMTLRFNRCFFILMCFLTNACYSAPTVWQTLAPGLSYTQISHFPAFPQGQVHAFQIDLRHYRFSIHLTQNHDQSVPMSLPELMPQQNAVIAVNGGFFSPEYKPLGLRISGGQLIKPLKPTAWWGVFFIKDSRARVVSQKNYSADIHPDFAIQAGPRLLDQGIIPKLKLDIDDRTALGINRAGKVILVATNNLMLSTVELARLMQRSEAEGGLGCVEALNLDGGHSTQLYTRLPNFSLQLPSYLPVADAILVTPL